MDQEKTLGFTDGGEGTCHTFLLVLVSESLGSWVSTTNHDQQLLPLTFAIQRTITLCNTGIAK